jgi:hypothetical protein
MGNGHKGKKTSRGHRDVILLQDAENIRDKFLKIK